jgi:hypothetical protein
MFKFDTDIGSDGTETAALRKQRSYHAWSRTHGHGNLKIHFDTCEIFADFPEYYGL